MYSIAFIVPYFTLGQGRLPDMFTLWLASCSNNPTVDWFLITDCETGLYDLPGNVKVIHSTFCDVRKREQSLFGFEISLNTPYKLCDYKPSYGEAFQDIIDGYDYWGFCDIDLLFGNIRKFLTGEILENNERILTHGHCSVFKNTSENNARYRTLDRKGCLDYKEVFSSDKLFAYDEWAGHNGGGYSAILKLNMIPMYDEQIYADIQINRYLLHTTREKNKDYVNEQGNSHTVFEIMDGNVIQKCINDGRVIANEYIYVHFQQRKLIVEKGLNKNRYLIVPPNRAIHYEAANSTLDLINMTKNRWWSWNVRGQIKEKLHNAKDILKHYKYGEGNGN